MGLWTTKTRATELKPLDTHRKTVKWIYFIVQRRTTALRPCLTLSIPLIATKRCYIHWSSHNADTSLHSFSSFHPSSFSFPLSPSIFSIPTIIQFPIVDSPIHSYTVISTPPFILMPLFQSHLFFPRSHPFFSTLTLITFQILVPPEKRVSAIAEFSA